MITSPSMRTFLLSALTTSALCGGALLSANEARAAGFYIQEQSVSGLGSAFSGSVTNIDDPSTVYFNPAGMTRLDGTQFQAGVHILAPTSALTNNGSTAVGGGLITGHDGGNPYSPTPVPNGFATYQINDKLWAGISVTAPFGLSNEYDPTWFGRFDSIETHLKVIDVQPSLAYKVNDYLSLAAGVNIQHSDAKLTQAAQAPAGTEGLSILDGQEDRAVGYTLGMTLNPQAETTLGISYHSAITHTLEGFLKTEGTGVADFRAAGQADLALPDILKMGVAHDLNDKWTVQGQATWFGWSNFEDITSIAQEDFSILGGAVTRQSGDVVSDVIQGYEDTWAISLGAEYKANDQWTLRGGMQFDETPTVDQYRTSRTPDGDRTWLSGGATYNMNDRLSIDLAATYIWIDDGTIDVDRNNSFSTAVQTNVNAKTEGSVGIVAMGLTYKF